MATDKRGLQTDSPTTWSDLEKFRCSDFKSVSARSY